LNILYCGDDGICDGILLSALSLCKHSKESMSIYVMTASVGERRAISKHFAEKLECVLAKSDPKNKVILIDATELFCDYLPTANMGTRFTPLCMLRLFSDLVSDIPDKILYLDTDVLCRQDFSALYYTDISDIEIAGVPDRYGKWFFGNVLRHDYLNSGVLLMNMKNIRKSGLFKKCRSMCRDKKMFMPDQSALNKIAVKRKLPVRYNEQGRIKHETVFKHFTTFFAFFPYVHAVTVKPWQTDKLHRQLKIFEFDDIIERYQKEK